MKKDQKKNHAYPSLTEGILVKNYAYSAVTDDILVKYHSRENQVKKNGGKILALVKCQRISPNSQPNREVQPNRTKIFQGIVHFNLLTKTNSFSQFGQNELKVTTRLLHLLELYTFF